MRQRSRERLQREGERRDADIELVGLVESVEGLRDWEREVLEQAHERVHRYGRCLLDQQQGQLHDILERRGMGGDVEVEPDL